MDPVNNNLKPMANLGLQKYQEIREVGIRFATATWQRYDNFCATKLGLDGATLAKTVAVATVAFFVIGAVASSLAGTGMEATLIKIPAAIYGGIIGLISIGSELSKFLLRDVVGEILRVLLVDLVGGVIGQLGNLVGLVLYASLTTLVAGGTLIGGFCVFKGYQIYRGWQNFLNPPAQQQQHNLNAEQVDVQHQFLNTAIDAALGAQAPGGEENANLRNLLRNAMQNPQFKNVILREARQGNFLVGAIGGLRVGLFDAVNAATDDPALRDQLRPLVETVVNAALADGNFRATLQLAPAAGGAAPAPQQPNVNQVGQQHVLLAIALGRFANAHPIAQENLNAARATIQNNVDLKNAILHALRANQALGDVGALRDALSAAVLQALPGDENQALRQQFTPMAEALVNDALQNEELKATTRPAPPAEPAPMPYPEGDFNIRHVFYFVNQLRGLSDSVMTNLRNAYWSLRAEIDASPYVKYGVYGVLGATVGTITVATAAIGLMIIAGVVAAIGRAIGTFLYAGYATIRDGVYMIDSAVGSTLKPVGSGIYNLGAGIGNGVYKVGVGIGNGIYNMGSSVKQTLFGRVTTTFPLVANGVSQVGTQIDAANKFIGRTSMATP